MPGVPHHHAGLQAQALQVLANTLATPGIHVERGHVGIDQLQQVRGFATGGSAGVQYVQSTAAVQGQQAFNQQRRSQLGSGILH